MAIKRRTWNRLVFIVDMNSTQSRGTPVKYTGSSGFHMPVLILFGQTVTPYKTDYSLS